MTIVTKSLSAPAIVAALALAATPAAAVDLPVSSNKAPATMSSQYGPYYGGGWGGWGRNRHRGRASAGDILTGVLILGGIAAIANAASRRAQQRRAYPYPQSYPQPYPRSYPQPYPQQDNRWSAPNGLDGAAQLCMREIERNARVREVTRVERNAGGWLVSGAMADGAAFDCSIGSDGRIDRVDIGGRAQGYGSADRQYDDDAYRAARAQAEGQAQPAYPGGPLPGEEPIDEAPPSDPAIGPEA